MTSTLNKMSPVLSELEIQVPPEEVNRIIERNYVILSKEAKVRGFRKGKVPRSVLKKMFGPAVLWEARKDLIAEHLEKAIAEHDLIPLSQPEIDGSEVIENTVYKFTTKFENRPKIDEIKCDGIELKKHKITVKDEEIENEIGRIRSSMAEVTDLEEPRPAENGDLLKLKIKRWAEGEWQDAPWPDQEVVVGETRIEKKISEALIGMSNDEEKVVDLGSEKELDENRTRYLIKVTSIQARKLPDLDNEFAKDVGDYETLDELKEKIREQITSVKERIEERKLKDALFSALTEKNPFDLPPTLVEQQTEVFKMRVQSSFSMLGKNSPGENKEKAMLERAEKAARDIVHQHLLILECARINGIEIDEAAIEDTLGEIAKDNGFPLPMVKAEYAKEGRLGELAHQLLEKKIFDFLLPKVNIIIVDQPDETAGENV